MQVLLLVLFLVYLYAPFLLFKFFVEESLDLVRRKDFTKVEEFFAAALPSALLNGFAFAILRATNLARPIDWRVASGLLDPDLAAVREHIAAGPRAEIIYIAVLYLGSCVAGRAYGWVELKLMERGLATNSFMVSGRIQNRIRWMLALVYRRIWMPFFAASIHPLSPWMVQETWLFVRTKDDRLYYGRLFEYVDNAVGDVGTITLTNAQRYARRSVVDCISSGRSPLARLSGSFVMKWSDITDINIAVPEMMTAVRRKYAAQLRAYRKHSKTQLSLLQKASRLFSSRRPK